MLMPCAASMAADASAAPLIQGNGISVDAADVRADALRIPPEARKELLSDPNNAAQFASNLYVRRALAAEAAKAGLESDPVIQAQLRFARDRVLSDAQLARLDEANKPADGLVEQIAKTEYQANPQRFAAPDEIHVRHILVKGSDAQARAKAEKLLAELKGGADFEALAKKESDDPGSATNGGDVGFFGKGRMVKPFEDAAFALEKPGDLSGLVETQFGFHIIKLVERRAAGQRPYAEVSEALRAEAAAKILNNARTSKAKGLVEAAQFNRPAIEAFAASEKQAEPPKAAAK